MWTFTILIYAQPEGKPEGIRNRVNTGDFMEQAHHDKDKAASLAMEHARHMVQGWQAVEPGTIFRIA